LLIRLLVLAVAQVQTQAIPGAVLLTTTTTTTTVTTTTTTKALARFMARGQVCQRQRAHPCLHAAEQDGSVAEAATSSGTKEEERVKHRQVLARRLNVRQAVRVNGRQERGVKKAHDLQNDQKKNRVPEKVPELDLDIAMGQDKGGEVQTCNTVTRSTLISRAPS
jgi:hypothetical protein